MNSKLTKLALTAVLALAITLTLNACDEKKKQDSTTTEPTAAAETQQPTQEVTVAESAWDKRIPAGYNITEKVSGDLNGDGEDDYVLTIKTTNGSDSAGFMIFFKDGDGYKLVLENKRCFYTEFSWPTLSIKKGNLYFIEENSGTCNRYDYTHMFRYRNSEFELIGYDALEIDCGDWDENHMRVGGSNSKTSINFLTKKKLSTLNGKETWSNITVKEPILLRKIVEWAPDINNLINGGKQ